jgi:hypothetical protein
MLDASVPSTPFSLDANGAPMDLPLTVRNTGGTLSEPVVAVLNLPQGVSAIPIDSLSARRLLSLNGPRAGTVNCPGGHGAVTCTSEQGLAPNETVTLLFRLIAADNAKGGKITGVVTAGTDVNTSFTVQLNVRPAPVTDGVKVTAKNVWPGLLGWWTRPVVDVTVTNTGTSSRPVKLSVDQPAEVVSSTQTVTCSIGGATSCLTDAELAPGEKLRITFRLDLNSWSQRSLATTEVHISATLGSATDSTSVTVWDCLWPTPPTKPGHPGSPPAPPGTTPAPGTPTEPCTPTEPSEPNGPTRSNPPATTTDPTTPPTTTTTTPGTSGTGHDDPPAPPTSPEPPSSPEQDPGLLGGLLGWLLGG